MNGLPCPLGSSQEADVDTKFLGPPSEYTPGPRTTKGLQLLQGLLDSQGDGGPRPGRRVEDCLPCLVGGLKNDCSSLLSHTFH